MAKSTKRPTPSNAKPGKAKAQKAAPTAKPAMPKKPGRPLIGMG